MLPARHIPGRLGFGTGPPTSFAGKSLAPLIAHLSQTTQMKTVTQIDLSGILNQQNHGVLSDLFKRVLNMELHQRFKGHIFLIQQTVQGNHFFPALHLGRQRGRGIGGSLGSHLNGSSGSTGILQVAASERAFCPRLRVQHLFASHRPLLSALYLCRKDRPLGMGRISSRKRKISANCSALSLAAMLRLKALLLEQVAPTELVCRLLNAMYAHADK